MTRKAIRHGLEMNDSGLIDGRFDFDPSPKGRIVRGDIFVRASKADLGPWIDDGTFLGSLSGDEPIKFKAVHKGCSTVLCIKVATDRPKTTLSCPNKDYISGVGWITGGCSKSWEVHQLEALTPKGFGDTFEYIVSPKGDWPNKLVTLSNGVTKYLSCQSSTREQAAEYFFGEFDSFRSMRFRRPSQ